MKQFMVKTNLGQIFTQGNLPQKSQYMGGQNQIQVSQNART